MNKFAKLQNIITSCTGKGLDILSQEDIAWMKENVTYNQYSYRAMGSEMYIIDDIIDTTTDCRSPKYRIDTDNIIDISSYFLEKLVSLTGMSAAFDIIKNKNPIIIVKGSYSSCWNENI